MSIGIRDLIEAAHRGDWSPLLEESKKAPGKHWAEEARCSNQEVDIFVPLGDGPHKDPETVKLHLGISINRARNLCASCPLAVAARCMVESLRDDDEFGIRAGLLACERSPLRAAWQNRVDEEAVSRALQGSTSPLSKGEREAVIARFAAENPAAVDADVVARALGITREYLLKLAWRERRRSSPDTIASTTNAA
ncbi:WhiB family transcriptional regulator [Streptomyces xiamenensis]